MLARKIQKLMIPDELVLNSATVQGQLTVDGVITSNTNIDLNGSLTLADNSIIASANDYVAPAELNIYATTAALNNLNSTTSVIYAPMNNPIFAGTVTFPDNTFISPTTSSYVTASNLNNILTYNYAPLVDPTFTGNINLNGNVTLAQTSANTLTLNDHLNLCTGSNFATPVSGQQGYIVTGTNVSNQTSIPTATVTGVSSITLSYGVWFIIGQAGIYNSSGASSTCTMSNKQVGISTSATAIEGNYQNRSIGSFTLGIGSAACEQCTRIVTVTNNSTSYYLNIFVNYATGTLLTWTTQTNLYAVRLA
jgi:hypothetical protein